MFAKKICVDYERNGEWTACPIKWLDNFSMRSFTNASVFDDTLPVADGIMEIGTNVPIDQLKIAMEDWFQRKSYIAKNAVLKISDGASLSATGTSALPSAPSKPLSS